MAKTSLKVKAARKPKYEYQSVAAFAVASLLALLALVTLVIKSVVEWLHERELRAAADTPPENPNHSSKP